MLNNSFNPYPNLNSFPYPNPTPTKYPYGNFPAESCPDMLYNSHILNLHIEPSRVPPHPTA